MLAVAPQQFELPRDEISMDSAPTLEVMENEPIMKQEVKKSMFSPYKVLLALLLAFVLVMVSFKIYNEFIVTPRESEITTTHDKIIQNAGQNSSSKDKASNSGSSSSKASKSNDRPNKTSQPASKTPITSNTNLSGASDSSSNGGSDDDEDDKDGEKRKKNISENKSSDTKSSKYGSSTDDDDSVSVESDNDNELSQEDTWMGSNKDNGPEPLIGSTRKRTNDHAL